MVAESRMFSDEKNNNKKKKLYPFLFSYYDSWSLYLG